MPKLALYARKSMESEDRQVLSIDSQVRELKEFAIKQNLKVDFVFMESKSAKSPGRPVFANIVDQIQKGKLDGLICWKLDRLARNPVDGGALIWAMEEERLKAIHTPQRSFLNNGNDKFWMQLEFGMAKKYVDDLSDNVKRGLRAKISQGWMPGLPPLGYLNDRNTHTIIKDPKRFPIVRRMWDLMLTGAFSPMKILKIATSEFKLTSRKFARMGGGPIQYSTVYKIFTNPFYYGAILYNNELFSGSQKAMVTKSEFDRVQELLGLAGRPRPKQHAFPFTGLIKCGECGASITAENKTNRYGYKYIYYHCSKRKRSVICSQKAIEHKILEKQVSNFLSSLAISRDIRDWTFEILKELHDDERQKDKAILKSLHCRKESLREELAELVNLRLRRLLNDQEYLSKKSQLEQEQFRLRELLEDNEARFSHILKSCEDAFDFAYTAKNRFDNGSLEDKKAILCYCGSNLILSNGILQIKPHKPLELIRDTVKRPGFKNIRFEPHFGGYAIAKNAPCGSGVSNWLTLIKDVRTFYQENPDASTFKQTCMKVKKYFELRRNLIRARKHIQKRKPNEQKMKLINQKANQPLARLSGSP
ncbi:Resolvase protein (modular protein) [Candidatus Zixiibacteriota bacterium]|nr:Resolvase protein (modular protein) [candidate division Zixibacteria bacterium]